MQPDERPKLCGARQDCLRCRIALLSALIRDEEQTCQSRNKSLEVFLGRSRRGQRIAHAQVQAQQALT